jgi:hypothetical protein
VKAFKKIIADYESKLKYLDDAATAIVEKEIKRLKRVNLFYDWVDIFFKAMGILVLIFCMVLFFDFYQNLGLSSLFYGLLYGFGGLNLSKGLNWEK